MRRRAASPSSRRLARYRRRFRCAGEPEDKNALEMRGVAANRFGVALRWSPKAPLHEGSCRRAPLVLGDMSLPLTNDKYFPTVSSRFREDFLTLSPGVDSRRGSAKALLAEANGIDSGPMESSKREVGMSPTQDVQSTVEARRDEEEQRRREQEARVLRELSARENISQDVDRVRDRVELALHEAQGARQQAQQSRSRAQQAHNAARQAQNQANQANQAAQQAQNEATQANQRAQLAEENSEQANQQAQQSEDQATRAFELASEADQLAQQARQNSRQLQRA